MAKTNFIELSNGKLKIPIIFENRSILIIDKPAGWILAPAHWKNTARNLQREIEISILCKDFWARCRNLKYLRFVHRLDSETSGLLILAKNAGAIPAYNNLFTKGIIEKTYAAVVEGVPRWKTTTCILPIAPDEKEKRMKISRSKGKKAETNFYFLKERDGKSLILAIPRTGRTHQIRLHLSALGLPVIGDELYGKKVFSGSENYPLGLRAARLKFHDPFERKEVDVQARMEEFLNEYGFEIQDWKWHPNDS